MAHYQLDAWIAPAATGPPPLGLGERGLGFGVWGLEMDSIVPQAFSHRGKRPLSLSRNLWSRVHVFLESKRVPDPL
jgi:hypothetical protein